MMLGTDCDKRSDPANVVIMQIRKDDTVPIFPESAMKLKNRVSRCAQRCRDE
jgi:hypothetical protein